LKPYEPLTWKLQAATRATHRPLSRRMTLFSCGSRGFWIMLRRKFYCQS